MPEKRIPLEPGEVYHIWTHANGSENLFQEEENYHFFLKKYLEFVHPVVDTYAYCLMPNHLHLMVKIKGEKDVFAFICNKKLASKTLQGFETLGGFSNVISRQFSHLFNSYTQSYNKYFNRKGSLFIPNFKRKRINSDNYYGICIAYIHNNPVHHKFVDSPDMWEFSSWHSYLSEKTTQIKKEEGINWFGGKEQFIRVHQEIIMEKMRIIFE